MRSTNPFHPHRPAARHSALLMALLVAVVASLAHETSAQENPLSLKLRYRAATEEPGRFEVAHREETWDASRTAIIICDAWDLHHSRNAVRRLEEFAPTLNDVLSDARARGVTIIHAPSDCMDFYADHPARGRAIAAPTATTAPPGVEQWCLQVPREREADYPIDQSDGGEDDDHPAELAKWGEKLKALGRNPRAPWKRQTELLTIDPDRDYITSLGDEVWNVLEDRGIENVILTGVHLNMCVLGRPFGLRQMVRGGKNVVLMRDMTDTMYNPARWPYVSHYEGTDLMVAYVERHICPTITSDQFIGGVPFRFKDDRRAQATKWPTDAPDPRREWVKVTVPLSDAAESGAAAGWYRCVVRIPEAWKDRAMRLTLPGASQEDRAWLNGRSLAKSVDGVDIGFPLSREAVAFGTGNLLVIRTLDAAGLTAAPVLTAGGERLELRGRWQHRVGDDETWSGMSLPAQFGAPGDIVFQPADEVR